MTEETRQPGAVGGLPQQGQQGQQRGGPTEPDIQLSETERTQKVQAMRELNWEDAQEAQVQLNELPQAARNTLNTVTAGAQVNQQATRLTKDNYEVFRATVNRAGQEDLQIFVAQDGSVIQTKQSIPFSEAPQSVQKTLREQLGETEPQQVERVIADDETFYVASKGPEGPQAQKIRVDNTGRLVGPDGQQPATTPLPDREAQDD
jgi:hypothetical protein